MTVKLPDQVLREALANLLGHSVRAVRRVVIDIQSDGEPPRIYVERFDEGRLVNVIQALKGVEVKYVEPPSPVAEDGKG
jgi:hypothetical protein